MSVQKSNYNYVVFQRPCPSIQWVLWPTLGTGQAVISHLFWWAALQPPTPLQGTTANYAAVACSPPAKQFKMVLFKVPNALQALNLALPAQNVGHNTTLLDTALRL